MDDEQCYSASADQIFDMFDSIYAICQSSEELMTSLGIESNDNVGIRIINGNVVAVGVKWYKGPTADKLIPYIREHFDVDDGDDIVLK